MNHSHPQTTQFCNHLIHLQQLYIRALDISIRRTLRELEQVERVYHSSAFSDRPVDEQTSVQLKRIHLQNLYCMLASIKNQIAHISQETLHSVTEMTAHLTD